MIESIAELSRWIAVLFVLLGLIIGFRVAIWLLEFLIDEAVNFIEFTVAEITAYLEKAIPSFFAFLFSLITAMPYKLWHKLYPLGRNALDALQEQYKLWELYLEYGKDISSSFSEFKRCMRGEEEPRNEDDAEDYSDPDDGPEPEPEPKTDNYQQALNLMGFGNGKDFTKPELKKRHRQLRSKAHPDKGGDRNKFHQINAAYDLIMKRRAWT